MSTALKRSIVLSIFSFLYCVTSLGASATVSSWSALKNAVSNLNAGDVITVKNGTYNSTEEIEVLNANGTANNPIVIQAETIGGVTITGVGSFDLKASSSYIVIKGFVFMCKAQTGGPNRANHCLFTRNVYECTQNGTSSSSYLKIWGNDNEISYNIFKNKTFVGPIISIQGSESAGPVTNTWVHHNHFKNFTESTASNDNSAIQPTYGKFGNGKANTIVEFNLFEDLTADAEGVISIKCWDVKFRYNTVIDCSSTNIRSGQESSINGNFFFNSTVRFSDDKHKIYNNTFIGVDEGIKLFSRLDASIASGYSHERPDDCFIGFNNFVNCDKGFVHDGTGSSRNLELVNNIFYNCDKAVELTREDWMNPTFSGNILHNSPRGQHPTSGQTNQNPQFDFDGDGVPHLKSNSPAIDAATGSYSFVNTDMDGQSRTGTKDIGADELGLGNQSIKVLTSSNVGPDGTETMTMNNPPSGSFTNPVFNTIEEGYGDLYVLVEASDPDGDNITLTLKIDGAEIRTEGGAPYEWGHVSTNPFTDLETQDLLPGTHLFEVIILDDKGASTTISKTITVTESKAPYAGVISIPGELEAENYDKGGQGISYNDTDMDNNGATESNFRENDAVDIGLGNGGKIVGWTKDGEWLEYSVNITESGVYEFDFYVSSIFDDGELSIELDGNSVLSGVTINSTGLWTTYASFKEDVDLVEGDHVLRLNIDKGRFNLDKIVINKKTITSTSKEQEVSLVSFFPNPSKDGVFNLNTVNNWEVLTVRGELLKSGNSDEVNLMEYAKGIYLLRINNTIKKLVIQ